MMDSLPSIAPASPPLTGASSTRTLISAPARASSREVCGLTVEKSIYRTSRAPSAFKVSNIPNGPSATSSTCGQSGSMVTTISAYATASAMVAAAWPPTAASRSIEDCL